MSGAPELPSPCPPPSPLEVGQLLLQEEHVGFELIPLLKDLLELLSTEAALSCLGRAPWLLQGSRLQKDRRRTGWVRGVPLSAPPFPWAITGMLEGATGGETWGGKGAATDDSPVLWPAWEQGPAGDAHSCATYQLPFFFF